MASARALCARFVFLFVFHCSSSVLPLPSTRSQCGSEISPDRLESGYFYMRNSVEAQVIVEKTDRSVGRILCQLKKMKQIGLISATV